MDEPFAALDAETREGCRPSYQPARAHRQDHDLRHPRSRRGGAARRPCFIFSPSGEIHEIVDINIPHPRDDAIAVRGSDEFQKKRFYIWKTLKMTDKPQAESAMSDNAAVTAGNPGKMQNFMEAVELRLNSLNGP